MLAIKMILHPTDFSERSDFAFGLACALARDYGARLHVLHVGSGPVMVPVEGIGPPEPERYQDELTAKLHEMRAEAPDIPVEHQLLFVGDPAAEILRVAQAIKSDLIVMGTHGRTGLGRLLMGSVAEQVVRKAACPVLTVKVPQCPPSSAEEPATAAAGEKAEATT